MVTVRFEGILDYHFGMSGDDSMATLIDLQQMYVTRTIISLGTMFMLNSCTSFHQTKIILFLEWARECLHYPAEGITQCEIKVAVEMNIHSMVSISNISSKPFHPHHCNLNSCA
jgi:hypothetical protein